MPHEELQPDWFHDNAPAYVAGGLSAAERERMELLAKSNDAYRIELEDLMALDASMHRAAGVESIVAGLEDRIAAALPSRRWLIHPVVRRAALSAAACVVLGGFGYLASERMETNQLWGWNESSPSGFVGTGNVSFQVGGLLNPFQSSSRIDRLSTAQNSSSTSADQLVASVKGTASNGPPPLSATDRRHGGDADGDRLTDTKIIQKEAESKSFPLLSSKIATGEDIAPKEFIAPSGTAEADTPANRGTVILGNAKNHDQDGQNVYYSDGHAEFKNGLLASGYIPGKDLAAATDSVLNLDTSGVRLSLGDHSFKPGDLAKSGSGTLVLNGGNTYSGGTVVSAGTLVSNTESNKEASKREWDEKAGDKSNKQVALDLFGKGKPAQNAPAPVAPAAPPPAPAVDNRKIIRTGEMEFEVDRFDSAVAIVSKIISDEKGFVATTTSDKLANGKVRGQIIVRIPPDHLDAFVMQLRALGDLKSQRIGSADVTKEYTDLESELRSCRAMEERLLDMIKNGKGEIKDLLEAEKELAIWRGKIEKIIGQMKYFDNQVSLSTLTITLMERDIRTAAATVEQETINAGVEADDVEKARTAALAMLGEAKARIVSADLNKLDAGQMAATIVADIPPDNAGPVIDRVKQLGKVARLEAKKSQTADPNNPSTPETKVERRDSRLTLSIYNVANVAPRQSSSMNLAVADVQAAYANIVTKVSKAGGRVVSGGATQTAGDNSRASAQVEVPADAAEGFLMDLRSLGEVVALSTTSNPDTANVTVSKRGFAISIFPIATLPPRQTGSFSIEAGDVEQASAGVQAMVMQVGGRIVGNNVQSNPGGVSSATLSIELPLDKSAETIAAVRSAGKVLSVATLQNPNAPSGPAAKCRLDVSFTTAGPLTGETGGLMANLRNGFSLSAKGLVYSAQLVVIGLCFVLPWVLVIYIVSKLWKRRKPVTSPMV